VDGRPRKLEPITWLAVGLTAPSAIAGVALDSVWWTNVAWTVAAVAAMAGLWHAALLAPEETRGGWRMLAYAGTAWLAGQILWDLWSLGLPMHLVADLSWLLFAPFSAVGLARVAATESRGRQLVWETGPVVTATAALVMGLLYNDFATASLDGVERWVAMAYPVIYSVVPAMTAQVLLADRVRISRRPDLVLVALGIAVQAIGFTLWAPRLLHETYAVGGLLDASWTLGLILIAIGGLRHNPRMDPLAAGGERRLLTFLPGLLFAALLVLLLVGAIGGWPLAQRLILQVGALATGVLIGVRMVALARRQTDLLEAERRTRNALERAADELTHVALHDPLTQLPNRSLFIDRATHALAAARRADTFTAVLFLDVDDFKRVNDVFGHSAGDALLRDLAIRVSEVVRPTDTVSRFGGDEFTILCPGLESEDDALHVAQRVIDALDRPFAIGARELHAAASVGIAFSHGGAGDAEGLVRDADAAMYRAKEHGRGGYEVFDEQVRERVVERLRIESALRDALERGELRLAYQPFFCLEAQRVLGFEALLRWESPELGTVVPGVFIPIAEHSGLMQRIGAWVLDEALGTIAELRRAHPELDLNVAINLSARQVHDPCLTGLVRAALATHELPPHALALEITESHLIEDAASVRDSLGELRDIGVRLMLDDFGTGFSSLSYLKRLPVHTLKIDQSFVAGLGSDAGDRAIVAAIMGVARALDLQVIAEGVENERQAAELVALGCPVAQGFLYAKPTYEPATVLSAPAAAA
jgi:diguanylate cyclase (GGDEF)-like protein